MQPSISSAAGQPSYLLVCLLFFTCCGVGGQGVTASGLKQKGQTGLAVPSCYRQLTVHSWGSRPPPPVCPSTSLFSSTKWAERKEPAFLHYVRGTHTGKVRRGYWELQEEQDQREHFCSG